MGRVFFVSLFCPPLPSRMFFSSQTLPSSRFWQPVAEEVVAELCDLIKENVCCRPHSPPVHFNSHSYLLRVVPIVRLPNPFESLNLNFRTMHLPTSCIFGPLRKGGSQVCFPHGFLFVFFLGMKNGKFQKLAH